MGKDKYQSGGRRELRTVKPVHGAGLVRGFVGLLLCLGSLVPICQAQELGPTTNKGSASKLCKSLRNVEIPSSAIGLATKGACVSLAKMERSRSAEFCKVLGEIRPVDPQAQESGSR